MSIKEKAILVFGGGALQLSVIEKCREMQLFTVVVDLNPNAEGKTRADAFEAVAGDDFETTCAVVERYRIKAIITTATDKPLVMMARIAEKYGLRFFSVETATASTDKYLMKRAFQENGIPCAKGRLITEIDDSLTFPLIMKPRDNSGSRGIIFCRTKEDAENNLAEAFAFSKKESLLVEEFIGGKEYSVEALHFAGETRVLQITEKITTPHPYNVELGHIQPAELDAAVKERIDKLIEKIGRALKFENCASHTELKINEDGIFVIETSPRMGGDFITSRLVPLSTGIDMERALIEIALGETPDLKATESRASAVFYFDFDKQKVENTDFLESMKTREGVDDFAFDLKKGDAIPKIKNSLDRYGQIVMVANNRQTLLELADKYRKEIEAGI